MATLLTRGKIYLITKAEDSTMTMSNNQLLQK